MENNTESESLVERLNNDAKWLRLVADDADGVPREGDQTLWPETVENLRDIADEIERLTAENERLRANLMPPSGPICPGCKHAAPKFGANKRLCAVAGCKCPCNDFLTYDPGAQVLTDKARRERGNLVCSTCNDYHDEESVCGVCHETACQIIREQNKTIRYKPEEKI